MNPLFSTSLGQFRLVSLAEGISYIILLGFAMPMKYMAGDPIFVRIFGSLHGLLFVVFMVALLRVAFAENWRLPRVLMAFVASIVPLGAFALEFSLKKEMKAKYGSES